MQKREKAGTKARKFLNRFRAVLMIALFTFIAAFASEKEIKADDINAADVFLKEPRGGTCTLTANTNMIRRSAILHGDTKWREITVQACEPSLWISGQGQRVSYSYTHNGITYKGLEISNGYQNLSAQGRREKIISLLAAHPEGVVVYKFSGPTHAVLITGYSNGTFYCADPASGIQGGIIPLSKAYGGNSLIDNGGSYWYLTSPPSIISHTNPWSYSETPGGIYGTNLVNSCYPQVKWIQAALNIIQNAGLAEDGYYGNGTKNAVVAFQQNHGLSADGVVGPQTTGKMVEELAARGYHSPDPQPVHTHSYTARTQVISQPTCTTAGTERDFCSCGQYQDKTLPALGHSYVSKVVASTISERGYTLHTCTRCGNSYKDTYTDAPSKAEDGWYYVDSLPTGVDSSNYVIEYNNHYERQQTTSPGDGWTEGQKHVSYVNDGSQYEEYTTVNTSDTKVLVRYYYYHFCTKNLGQSVSYREDNTYVHFDSIEDPNSVNLTSQGMTNGNIPYCTLAWKSGGDAYCISGTTCDGKFGTHGKRSNIWYRMNVYQNRHAVVSYTYTKDSGWVSEKDAGAVSTKIRFKQKEAKVTGVEIKTASGKNIVVRGTSLQFSAKVAGEYLSDTSVKWTVDGNTSQNTAISNDGLLKTGSDEKSASLTVKAIANADAAKTASLTVKVQLFKDVSESQFFYNAVKWGSDSSTVAGYSEGDGTSTFRPNDVCTRAQFVTFLWRTLGSQRPKSRNNPFVDIPDIKAVYYGDAVLWAYENHYVAGYSDPKGVRFAADDEVTRGQTVTFLWRAAGSPKAKSTNSPFVDAVNPSNYFYGEAMLWANENGVVSGYSEPSGVRFAANDQCTRGQVVTFLWRYAKKYLNA